jgi:glutamate--cysteine ligase catalytic subunit
MFDVVHLSLRLSQIEYLVVAIDEANKKVRLSLCQADVLKALAKDQELAKQDTMVPELQGDNKSVRLVPQPECY